MSMSLTGKCLTGRLENGLLSPLDRPLRWWYEHPKAIPERPDGPPVGEHRAPLPAGPAAGRQAGAAMLLPQAGDRQRGTLPGQGRVCLEDAAARLPALEDGVLLLLHLAGQRAVGGGPRRPAAAGPGL